jgi:type IV pilus assembly protein PilY1
MTVHKRQPRLVAELFLTALVLTGWAALPAHASDKISQVPLYLTDPVPPVAMIDLPKDQSLFKKAYDDYSDLDGDGKPETTYDDSIDYTGYFDYGICYGYSGGVFIPQAKATGANEHYCDGDHWSGNFLNWATMSRMDIVRLILYGGKRIADSSEKTILVRAFLPPDAHSWAKYYNGDDIAELTPFDPQTETKSTDGRARGCGHDRWCEISFPTDFSNHGASSCGSGHYAKLKFKVDEPIFYIGDQVRIKSDGGYMIGGICGGANGRKITVRVDDGGVHGSGKYRHWRITNLSQTGISVCNTTIGSGMSQNSKKPPLMRVVKGDYALWSANEGVQCQWYDDDHNGQSSFEGGFRSNGNRAALSGLYASAENPDQDYVALGNGADDGVFHVAVEACVPGLIAHAQCKKYPDGDYKPTGLLQKYGDDGRIHFGLFTGTYPKNFSGGVLRANARSLSKEVDVNGDGHFRDTAGIIDTLDRLRIYGYKYGVSDNYGSGDGCTYQITDPLANGEGKCESWGNPFSEIYLESLRYLAGLHPTPAFVPAQQRLGLTISTWEDPLSQKTYCAPLDVLAFDTGAASFDDDQMGGLSDLPGSPIAKDKTTAIGNYEGINGAEWFIGNTATKANALCSAKMISALGDIYGLCPEAPSLHGSYLIAGAAWYAHTHRIRTDLNVPDSDPRALKVKTYGVQLATSTPRINVNVDGNRVTILPAYRLDRSSNGSGPFGTGALVDFKIVNQAADGSSGTYYANWEDSNQGGDYDQDVWGEISYEVSGDTIRITTDTISASTNHGQGFGYVISGTTEDGPHFVSGIYGFDYTNSNGQVECDNCELQDPPVTVAYSVGDTSAGSLQTPLYYAAKWGGFRDQNENKRPDKADEWDVNGDGTPDNYFYAVNPLQLKSALNAALGNVSNQESSATSVAANSAQLNTGSVIYQARFGSKTWWGNVFAYGINPEDGSISETPKWSAAEAIDDMSPTSRNIFTWEPSSQLGDGTEFKWANLNDEQQTALDTIDEDGEPNDDGLGNDRVKWLRGDRSFEVQNGGKLRDREHVLGDIVNSNPTFVGHANYRYYLLPPGSEGSKYAGFRGSSTYKNRSEVLYVGANDGMLHALDADTGKELFAYVPNGVYPDLSSTTQTGYGSAKAPHHYLVDGPTHSGDAYFNNKWHTVLVGSLGAGGKGVYALDVTTPDSFSASDVLWEYDSDERKDDDLGYTIGQPTVVRLDDGHWYVMFANGYASEAGSAVLYLVRLDADNLTNAAVIKIVAKDGDGDCEDGLSSPIPVDINGDRITDYAYAGDLCGNLWKFDLRNFGNGNPKNSFSLIFHAEDSAGRNQPITARPEVGINPNGGYMIYFGTGQYFTREANLVDETNGVRNDFYAIWDNDWNSPVKRSDLLQEKILQETDVDSKEARVVSRNDVDYVAGQKGWRLDLISPDLGYQGERVVSAATLRDNRIIFSTLIPTPNTQPCKPGGTGWFMELRALSGGRVNETVIDINNDGKFNEDDSVDNGDGTYTPISGKKSPIGIISTPGIVSDGSKEYKYLSGSSGDIEVIHERASNPTGRKSWREIHGGS